MCKGALSSRETMQQKSMSTLYAWMSPTCHLDPVLGANPDKINLMQKECMSAGDADTSVIWGPKGQVPTQDSKRHHCIHPKFLPLAYPHIIMLKIRNPWKKWFDHLRNKAEMTSDHQLTAFGCLIRSIYLGMPQKEKYCNPQTVLAMPNTISLLVELINYSIGQLVPISPF